jgi:hypothetical protein
MLPFSTDSTLKKQYDKATHLNQHWFKVPAFLTA